MIMPLIMILMIAPRGGEELIIATCGSIIPRPSPSSTCTVAIAVITLNTMLTIDKTIVTVQAHLRPLNSPYATTNETIPIAIITPPIAIGPPPISEGGTPERYSMSESSAVKFPSSKAAGGSEERAMPAAMKAIPPRTIIIPTMMLRIAIIVTPVGWDLDVACKLLYRNKA